MDTSYTSEITVDNTPEAAYTALTIDFHKWWTTECGQVGNIGDEITYKFGATYWVMRATNLVPNKTVELECVNAHHVHDGLPSSILNEWRGTKLKWQIHVQDSRTIVKLTHEGLLPSLVCYDICKQGWDYFFVESLKQYLNTGKGSPFESQA